jgi:preprotein translocase subunit SecG
LILTGIIVVLHVIVALVLILFILLKSGRGGGLSDMFGGGAMSSMSGSTVVEKNLDRLTVIAGVIFALTTIVLSLRLS